MKGHLRLGVLLVYASRLLVWVFIVRCFHLQTKMKVWLWTIFLVNMLSRESCQHDNLWNVEFGLWQSFMCFPRLYISLWASLKVLYKKQEHMCKTHIFWKLLEMEVLQVPVSSKCWILCSNIFCLHALSSKWILGTL